MERAIELNGVAVSFNLEAFDLGRRLAHDPRSVLAALKRDTAEPESTVPESLDALVAHRAAFLEDYQDRALADRYKQFVDRVATAENAAVPGATELAYAAAERYFQLLAYKDEYEVARLFLKQDFKSSLDARFEPGYRIEFQLAPPVLSGTDPVSGRPVKRSFGAWILVAFRVLRAMRSLRGSAFDPFGYQRDRREERRLIGEYETSVEQVLAALDADNHGHAVEVLQWPRIIRGFGPVKHANIVRARAERDQLLSTLKDPPLLRKAA
jgi:indolepyruvate ferredoxin oxidoreductase